jgi:Uncharacterised nucleotidyltransferase
VSHFGPALPPLPTVQAALRTTTETLAQELAHPSAEAPGWSPFEWRVAMAVASLHGVSGVLGTRLRWTGPADWVRFLAEQRLHIQMRQARASALLRAIHERARDEEVAFVAMKGAALHELGLYAGGERPMADLDLLVDAADVERMAGVLQAQDYHQTVVTWKHRVFEALEVPAPAPFGEHAHNAIKIDLHVRVREILPLRPVDVALLPAQPRPGLNPYRSRAALMAHLLLHAAGAMTQRTLRLVQLHDLALLSAQMSSADWDELTGPIALDCGLWWALAPLLLLAHYYDPVPAQVVAAASIGCRWPLRRFACRRLLWQVSFSDLRRSAFPGIEWSRSAGEGLAFAAQRVTLLAPVLTRTMVTGAVTSRRNGAAGEHRSRLPAGGWMALKPARPATLQAVCGALAQPS